MSTETFQGKKFFQHSRQEIMKAFEKLRQVQRRLYAELANSEIQLHEYREVIKTLKSCHSAEKCFHSQSDILMEKTVQEMFPILVKEKDALEKQLENLRKLIDDKSREVQKFQDTYNIRVITEKHN
ncbi:uncharacterized protein TNCT_93291 [Trichonephila clavata]|uniref:Uncharacterized protein n=1 Tax=Trichonephila clavata TaxID=2740835 RepID=A0A8X6H2U4_TRICU|nr:uncharacterized protein TNCT_93291 [Trichonephila clavata]